MPHLVAAWDHKKHGIDGSIARCIQLIEQAHATLAAAGAECMTRAAVGGGASNWGSRSKRMRVLLPKPRLGLLDGAADDHSLIEVINQCATMERLLDALRWAASESSGMSTWVVVACHPTTSSGVGSKEHDLQLQSADGTQRALFEVSDVASTKDGNRKELRDLRALGLLDDSGAPRVPHDDVATRRFLVVADEFAKRLRSRKGRLLGLRFEVTHEHGQTVVVEVSRASAGRG